MVGDAPNTTVLVISELYPFTLHPQSIKTISPFFNFCGLILPCGKADDSPKSVRAKEDAPPDFACASPMIEESSPCVMPSCSWLIPNFIAATVISVAFCIKAISAADFISLQGMVTGTPLTKFKCGASFFIPSRIKKRSRSSIAILPAVMPASLIEFAIIL